MNNNLDLPIGADSQLNNPLYSTLPPIYGGGIVPPIGYNSELVEVPVEIPTQPQPVPVVEKAFANPLLLLAGAAAAYYLWKQSKKGRRR